MNNNIVISLDQAEFLFQTFREKNSLKKIPNLFKFDQTKSINENLNRLSLFALHNSNTLAVLYSFKKIFLELIARWINNTVTFENEFNQIYNGGKQNQIEGSVVIYALSTVVGLSNESIGLIEYFLRQADIFSKLSKTICDGETKLSYVELESILLAFYRLAHHDSHRFKILIVPEVLHTILSLEGSEFNVSKYLSIKLLSTYLDASEESEKHMINTHLNSQEVLKSTVDYESEIHFEFLSLHESKRLSNFTSLPPQPESSKSKQVVIIEDIELNPLVKSVCGVLVPNLLQKETSKIQLADSKFVPTENSINVLRQLASYIQNNQPTMLYGKAGSGKTFLINQLAKYMNYEDSIVKIHLGEQTDAKLLLGTYSSGEKPGTFQWRSGILTTAVKEGKWVLIEDIDKAPTEVLSVLLTLLEKRELSIPSRGEIIKAKNGFQLISTIRISNDTSKFSMPDLIGMRLWKQCEVEVPSEVDLRNILVAQFPLLKNLIHSFIKCYNEITRIYSLSSFISLNKGSHPRVISFRDLMKFCARSNRMLLNEGIISSDALLESSIYDNIFAEAVDCFGSAITENAALVPLINTIGESLEIPTSRINLFLSKHVPLLLESTEKIKIGRATLSKSASHRSSNLNKGNNTSFARTNHSLRLMEQIGVSIQMAEPLLLVGETGTGKTTVIQEVAKMMNKKLTVINVSQQTESGDLLGGYKPVNTKTIAVPLQEFFEELFIASFSKKKNEKFSQVLSKCFNRSQWKNVIKLWREAVRMAKDILSVKDAKSDEEDEGAPKKKRKLRSVEKVALIDKWRDFEEKIREFEIQSSSLDNSFVFSFVEGSLVKAVRNGDWLLLDEINLASSDTLESIADLLSESLNQRSILLAEKGDIDSIKAHPEFRIFGCMNPSTDVGKRDLPPSIRSRFTELYVHSPDKDMEDLLSIIDKYLNRYSVGDEWVVNDIAELYTETKKLAEANKIVDGANQKPHFSIRTLTRTLIYVRDIVSIYGLRRSLYEGFCMAFLTLLDIKSEKILKPIIEKYTVMKLKNANSVMKQCPPVPSNDSNSYVQFKHYWMKRGPGEIIPQPHYIITPFVEKNMLNLVRATAGRRFPVLIQGPTSAGKTSMIKYLANITGHEFVRINNHEHTDLQEYLGTYVSDASGKLTFREGVLVEALRKGHWIVLDELNLAPTDVLEALNRLLDDNRELFIPETQEVVHPHPDFMIFATQNPPGMYGGRKVLSRAFRNRFLELHFDDIPQDELESILRERCQIAPSYGKKIVEVYRQLSIQRQSTRLFEQKNSFATLRDLFRWALRDAVGYEELAANGYMLLAERVRKEDEKQLVKQTIEKVMKVKLDMDAYYSKLENEALIKSESSIVWTKAMRRLAVLVATSIKYNEPLLLVGETGCGKTTVCQILAQFLGKELVVVNAHQNTETGDILGAQRPVRNRYEVQSKLYKNLTTVFEALHLVVDPNETLENLVKKYDAIQNLDNIDPELIVEIKEDKRNYSVLFEWNDGPLIHAMKQGNFFLLDEISLADDSVLERLNSVLEPERSLLLAEKGTEDAFITADEGFEFLATMNPGGDYGKKELSPALRNRFTEIWVPSMEDFNDVKQIVTSRLHSKAEYLSDPLIKFAQWFGEKYGGSANSGIISLRDILAWVQFINSCIETVIPEAALLHGASMVFIDALGTNNTAYLAENELRLNEHKIECVKELSILAGSNLVETYTERYSVTLNDDKVVSGEFSIPRVSEHGSNDSFNLSAPTTASNAMRVIRAMQVHKPILLEGSPGVGKTSLVSALAKATCNTLVRLNLSEQTDLVDLFGSDAPAEGGKMGEFVWRDAPFLRAMQKGEWVLLDEMNLASQSVLEGLNSCLDHRGEAYIPELDRSFTCHPDFVVFAAQNPQYQGGGRKGLPKSFINRFTVVYVDVLKSEDLRLISQHLYPNIDKDVCNKMIEFVSKLEEETVIKKLWGSSGGPWEFNLRDTLRWLDLLSSKTIEEEIEPSAFFDMIVGHRFRTPQDKIKAVELFEAIFGPKTSRDNYYNLGDNFLQVGGALIKRKETIQHNSNSNLVPLQCNFQFLESAIRCINVNLPLILTGPTNSGKTELIRFLAGIVGAKLDEFAMNSDVDSMDILGGYEQVDLTRELSSIVSKVRDVIVDLIVVNLQSKETNMQILSKALKLVKYIDNKLVDVANYDKFHKLLESYVSSHSNGMIMQLFKDSENLKLKLKEECSVKFEWFDGLLVQAVERGNWLILDNANLCSPSVLDRLNSLLETNGTLIVNECSLEDGSPRVIQPHPNFRLFLTVDPKYGELSRAMRNRGIELYMGPLQDRASTFDATILGLNFNSKVDQDLVEQMNDLYVEESLYKPSTAFVSSSDSRARVFSLITDILNVSEEENKKELFDTILGLLPFAVLNNIERWKDTVISSNEFNIHNKNLAVEIFKSLQFLHGEGLLENMSNIYEPIASLGNDTASISSHLKHFQTIHPLINSYIEAHFVNSHPYVDSAEPTFFLEVVSNILEASVLLSTIENKALSGKLSDLSYIERSAAFQLGRELKKRPRLDIFKLVQGISNYINNSFKQGYEELIFSSENFYQSLFDLQLIWKGLFRTATTEDESKLRVFQILTEKWLEKYSKSQFNSVFSKELSELLDSFGTGLKLTSGFSMEKIWEKFRREYPLNEESWKNAELLFALTADFDLIIKEQFQDSNEMVRNLRALILELYRDILSDKVNVDDFGKYYDELSSGIQNLKDLSSTFIDKRQNIFEHEFTLLSNFVEVISNIESKDCTEALFSIANNSSRPTFSLLKSSEKVLFSPYPSIFDSLWISKDGNTESLVNGLFSNELISSSLTKANGFLKNSGKYLQQNLGDINYLSKNLIINSNDILSNQKKNFKILLVSWFKEILEVHLSNDSTEIGDLLTLLDQDSLKELVIKLINLAESVNDVDFVQICKEFIIPSLVLVIEGTSIGDLGKAWVLFSCGAIQLYVPSSAFDPAIKEHILYDQFIEQQDLSRRLSEAWGCLRFVANGDEKIHAEKLLPGTDEVDVPEKPRVYRKTGNMEDLFEEWKAFMESTIDIKPLTELLSSAEELSEKSSKMIDIFQNNSNHFLMRLKNNFSIYSDINDILKGYIFGLKLGFDLITLEVKSSNSSINIDRTWPVNFVRLTDFNDITEAFDEMKSLSKGHGIDSIAPEFTMTFFMKLCFAHNNHINDPSLDSILHQSFQMLYYRWSLRRMKAEEETQQQGSLYKYSDPSTDIEGDFKSLFPDYEDVMDTNMDSVKKNDAFEDIYFALASIYITAFTSGESYDIPSLIDQGAELFEVLSSSMNDFQLSENNSSVFNTLIYLLSSSVNAYTYKDSKLDFYRGYSPAESKKAMSIVTRIRNSLTKLLSEWPEHATLQNIYRASEDFLSFPVNYPISRLLQKIEQIYTYIAEWEKYASSQVTLKVHFEDLTSLIVSWRKLELSTWSTLFDYEDSVLEKNMSKWWFHLFETIIVPNFTEEEPDEKSVAKLLGAINIFLGQTTYGEFEPRMKLLMAFKNHVQILMPNGVIFNSLSNIIQFYEQFMPVIRENIMYTRKTLEKDISEVILLASWKDVNIDALKQSARRSHNNLYKIVRKYRSLLSNSVTPMIESGISTDFSVSMNISDLPLIKGQVMPDDLVLECAQVSSWTNRPSRLRNISLIEKNMDVYISRVSQEELPSLYDYAKSIMEDMERLRKETPSELKESNKKLVNALKTQKRKLLSDTLREIRRIGLKTNVKANVRQVQATTNLLLINSKSFKGTLLESVDAYFYRIIDLLPRLRSAVSNGVAEDVPQVDAEKGLSAVENLVFSLVTTKDPLLKFSNSFSEIIELFNHFEHTATVRDTDLILIEASIKDSIEFNLKNIEKIIEWLPRLIEFSVEVISSTSKNGIENSTEVFTKAKLKILDFKNEIKGLATGAFTSATSSFIKSFREFYVSFIESLINWKGKYVHLSFVSDALLQWIDNLKYTPSIDSTSTDEFKTLEDLEKSYRELSNAVLVSIQKVTECQTETITEEVDDWLSLSQQRYIKYVNSTHHRSIAKRMRACLELISKIEYDEASSKLASSLTCFTLPFFRHYIKLISVIFKNVRDNYKNLSHAAYILSHSLYVLATKGFCSPEPPSEQKDSDNLQDGTGLGDGEGASNNSKDVEDDEDLSEQAQQPNEEQKDKDDGDEENDDAVDIEGDMAGNLEEASDQEDEDQEGDEEEQDLDEEIDDIDDLDPNAVDEKMWDEEAKDDKKEKDSDKLPENSNNDDEMEANESDAENNDENNSKDKKDDASNKDEEGDNDDEEEEDKDGDEGEDKDVGEQEDEVKNEENEALEQNVPETETLDLPEDMNLDGEDEDKEDIDEEDQDFDDKLDMETVEDKEQKDENALDEDENMEDVEEESKENENAEEDDNEEEEGEENLEDQEANDGEGDENEENNEVESDDETLGEKKEEETEGGMDMQEDEQETAEGVDGANEETNEDIDKDSAVKQESGEKGEGADNQVTEENDDVGATGGAAADQQDDMKDPDSKNQDDARDMAKESLKQLGDSLKEFHRRRQEIQEASTEEKEEKTNDSANQRPDEFQHVEGENADHDTQALGAADKDQVQSLNEENAIDEMEEDHDEVMKEEPQESNEVDDMEVDENENDQNPDAEADENFEGKTKSALIGERNKVKEDDEFVIGNELYEDEDEDDNSENNFQMDINELDDTPPMDIETARDLWRNSELATQELASGLCEQLRLVLEPTLATKLRGDYKTGKRLNMKRIIPYIASEFRKDKIWLRRTKPSKRQYQIMIAVDDSKSMSESKSTELAFHSIALVSKALSQLESGGLSIVRFGEDVRVVHPFDRPFNSQESGSKIFQWFDFQQNRTDVKELCNKSLSIFEDARASSSSDLWQLQIIISDGVCEDHETVQRLVRKAREEKIMLVFVVLDGINSNESILDMSQVSYVPDPNSGQLTLKVDKYLDSFPFEFYVVVRNINELPEMLSLILRQYFSEIARI